MGGELPKQFIEIKGVPILMRVIQNFEYLGGQIIVVLSASYRALWSELCAKHHFTVEHTVVDGGGERFESVCLGLNATSSRADIILVQDGVRPFASRELIDAVVEKARQADVAVPAIELVDTIRTRQGHLLDRGDLLCMQTPQGFTADVLRRSYNQKHFQAGFTDDVAVVQASGYGVHFTQGERDNIKITTPFDLKIAELLW